MALIRTNTTWVGSAGAPFYTQTYWLGAADIAHGNDALAALDTFLTGLSSLIDNALTWTMSGEVEVIDVATGQITSVLACTEQVGAGSNTQEALPPFTQLLCRFNTGMFINGRALRGRMFIPGMTEPQNNVNGQPDAGFRGGVQSNLDILVADSADLAVYSRTHHAAASVQSSSVWDQWAVLRSRRD